MVVRLAARDLAIGYPGRTIGRGLTFSAEAGEVLCLLGPNGCGKTTLFKTLLGLIPDHGGTVEIAGRSLAGMSCRDVARAVGYVPQAHAPPFPYSVLDVVLMGRTAWLAPFEAPSARDRTAAYEALGRLGIADLAEADYSRISGGQRQLVLIARALAQEASVLIMDEPTASLDFGNQARVIGEIARLAATGLAVVLSTHDPDHAFTLADSVALLQEGRLAALGAPAEVLTPGALARTYGIPVAVERLASGRTIVAPAIS